MVLREPFLANLSLNVLSEGYSDLVYLVGRNQILNWHNHIDDQCHINVSSLGMILLATYNYFEQGTG